MIFNSSSEHLIVILPQQLQKLPSYRKRVCAFLNSGFPPRVLFILQVLSWFLTEVQGSSPPPHIIFIIADDLVSIREAYLFALSHYFHRELNLSYVDGSRMLNL